MTGPLDDSRPSPPTDPAAEASSRPPPESAAAPPPRQEPAAGSDPQPAGPRTVPTRVFPHEPPDGGSLLSAGPVRPVSPAERSILEANGCTAEDWSRILVSDGFRPEHLSGARLAGRVVIGSTGVPVERAPGFVVPSGIRDSTIVDCELADGVLVDRVDLLHRTLVDRGALIASSAEVTHEPGTAFGNGQVLELICSPGGRPVPVHAETTCAQASALAAGPCDIETARGVAAGFEARCASRYGYVGRGARVTGVRRLDSSWIGPGAVLTNCAAVSRSTVLSDEGRPTHVGDGVILKESLVQWGAVVTDSAVVRRSLLCETSTVERHALVTNSVIGPATVAGEGEVSDSLVGPLVGFHHQALLISAFWPEGRGNVGYGANVGSNHTGRAPDQELRCGEGTFFGLGASIKMPADFSRAPYLLIATGVVTLPQRITFPFSLVAAPSRRFGELSGAINEIRPGWVLGENAYAVARNERKYARRMRGASDPIDTRIARPEIVDHVRRAADELAALSGKPWYTDRDSRGIGKNVMTEEARVAGLEAYRRFVRRYALAAAFSRLAAGRDLGATDSDPEWEYAGAALDEATPVRDPAALVRLHVAECEAWAREVLESKRRDDERGPRIIDDYAATHPAAGTDELVLAVRADAERVRAQAEEVLGRLRA